MKNKFNVGDKVTIADKYRNKYNAIVGVGEVICITHANDRLLYSVRFEDKALEPVFYSYELNLYNPAFKVGDKVKLSHKAIKWFKANCPRSRMIKGDKTYVVKDTTCGKIELKRVSDYTFDSGDLVLAEEQKEHKFKTGDKVYITEQAQEWMIVNGYKKYLTPGPKEIVCVDTYKDAVEYSLKGIDDLYFHIEDLSAEPVKMLVIIKEDESKEYKGLSKDEYRKRLASNWKEICNRYLEVFCNKHGYKYEPDMWVGSDPGTIAEVCDMFVSMDNIRYDVDNNIPDPDFEKWYWKNLELCELGVEHWMNFPSYCKGAPDEWTEERMKNLRTVHQRVEEAKKDLEKIVSELGGDIEKMLY